jgi:SAM-dependent methyltransferase
MSEPYGPLYAEIWCDALRLPGTDVLLESLASEVGIYFGLSSSEAAKRMKEHWDNRRKWMTGRFPQGGSAEDLKAYYSNDHGIYTGMYWHSLEPDRYALHSVAGLHLVQQFAEGRRVFEFGHGVGSTGLLFARHGFQVSLGDISKSYRSFAEHRYRSRGLNPRFVDLTKESPEPQSYDAVVSFDVLEHIPDPLPEIEKLRACLKPGGVMVLNIAFGRDPENPEHVLPSRLGVLDRIRGMGFERLATPTLLVYRKRDIGRLKRTVYRGQDVVDALASDLCGRWTKLRPLLRPYRSA